MPRTIAICLPIGLFLALFGLGLGLGCNDDFEMGRRMPTSNPLPMPDALPEEIVDPSKQPEECPASQPKDGETCPGVTRATIACKYAVRQCPNGYDVVHTICCGRGGIWVPCAVSDPCPEGDPADAGT